MKQVRKRPTKNILDMDLSVIPECNGYLISKDGRVFSVMELTSYPDKDGYKRVHVFVDGKHKRPGVHVLLAKTYLSPPLSGQDQVRHLDGDKNNNAVSNLAWGTSKENAEDKIRHGSCSGEKNANSKLTVEQVVFIKNQLQRGTRIKDLADVYGVSESTIGAIKSGQNWSGL